jgi:L-pipecolate oxidase
MKKSLKTHGLWETTAPPAPETTRLEGDHRADVAVVGGGYTGMSAALHLAEGGARVVLLEAREIGFGGSGRNVGLVNAGLWLAPDDIEKTLGTDAGQKLIAALGSSPDLVYSLIEKHGIACEAVRSGTLHCAHSPSGHRDLQRRAEQWHRRGVQVSLLGREDAARMIGSNAYYGALLDFRAGTIQPLAYVRGLANAAQNAGARLYTDSRVLSIEHKGPAYRLSTASGSVKADAVIIATNAYTEKVAEDMNRACVLIHFSQFATKPLPDHVVQSILPGRQGAWDTNTVLSSYRLDQSGRLVVGSFGRVDTGGEALQAAWARRTIRKVFPQVGNIACDYRWHGAIAMTPDHIPRFYEPLPGFVAITTFNGRGIGPGTVFGKVLSDYLLGASGDDIPLPKSEPKPVHLKFIRELGYEVGARAYHLIQRLL